MKRFRWHAATAVLALLAACSDDSPQNHVWTIDDSRVVSDRHLTLDATAKERLQLLLEPRFSDLFEFDLPAGWQELAPTQLRDLNFRAGAAECYLTRLEAAAPGRGALENVNRWRKQFALAPITDAELAALPKVEFLGQPSPMVDLSGTMASMSGGANPGSRMIGVFASLPMFAASLKLVGKQADVEAAREGFLAFVGSLHLDLDVLRNIAPPATEPGPAPSDAASGPPPGGGGIGWSAPPGWTSIDAGGIRLVTFATPGGSNCWITPLAGDGGGIAENLNRWRREVGLTEPLSAGEVESLPTLTILGKERPWVEASGAAYTGMGGPKVDGQVALLGTLVTNGDSVLFIKMVGPAGDVAKERESFVAFCRSLKVSP